MQTSKINYTPELEAAIKTAYSLPRGKRNVKSLARRFNVPVTVIIKFAARSGMGLPDADNDNYFGWTEREIEFIKKSVSRGKTYRQISASMKTYGMNRTAEAIGKQIRLLGFRDSLDGVTIKSVSEAMGVNETTVASWVKKGFLNRSKFILGNKVITESDIKDFIRKHPTRFSLAKVDQIWFLDLMFDGHIGDYHRLEKPNSGIIKVGDENDSEDEH